MILPLSDMDAPVTYEELSDPEVPLAPMQMDDGISIMLPIILLTSFICVGLVSIFRPILRNKNNKATK